MFCLYNKNTLEKTAIYQISEDSAGYPKFLVRKDKEWVWMSAKHYITRDEYFEIKNKTI
jgi:hypothetical protein